MLNSIEVSQWLWWEHCEILSVASLLLLLPLQLRLLRACMSYCDFDRVVVLCLIVFKLCYKTNESGEEWRICYRNIW